MKTLAMLLIIISTISIYATDFESSHINPIKSKEDFTLERHASVQDLIIIRTVGVRFFSRNDYIELAPIKEANETQGASVKTGDVLLTVDGIKFTKLYTLKNYIRRFTRDHTMKLKILRNNEIHELEIKVKCV